MPTGYLFAGRRGDILNDGSLMLQYDRNRKFNGETQKMHRTALIGPEKGLTTKFHEEARRMKATHPYTTRPIASCKGFSIIRGNIGIEGNTQRRNYDNISLSSAVL